MSDKKIELEELREIEFDILQKVAIFCEKNNIKYYLGKGTLLGAVKYQGYIPWDDDIDIIIPRPDYMRFIEIFNKSDISPELKVLSHYNDKNHPYPFIKLINTKTRYIPHSSIKYDIGVCIDIFPLDGLPENIYKSFFFYFKIYFFEKFYKVKYVAFRKDQKLLKKIILFFAKIALYPFSYQFFIKKINDSAQTCDYEISKFCGILTAGRRENVRVEKSLLQETIPLKFEGSEFPAPKNYDLWLKNLYGDYMALPPKRKQLSLHVFNAYWR